MRLLLTVLAIMGLKLNTAAQNQKTDTVTRAGEKSKKGWNFGALPAVSFDSDLGFQYGIVSNLYHYGNGADYPRYRHSVYMEWSRTTKGSGKNQIVYDSEHLIPNLRVNAEASLLTEQALYFYGFNGYNAFYNHDYENPNSPSYISKMYYRLDRKLTRFKSDFQGKITGRTFRWMAGFTFFNNKIGRVNFNRLNNGKSETDKLRDTTILYDKYVEWGLIPENQKNGGITNQVNAGLIYDTRDNEPNPMKGVWTELVFLTAPSFLGNKFGYTRLVINHRQYFTLQKEKLNLVYRVSYQGKISGTMPFYMLPYIYNTTIIRDGLGGAKTLRGVLRNRVVGEDILYGNMEVRWKFLKFTRFNQNFYAALTGFTDIGRVTGKYNSGSTVTDPAAIRYLNQGSPETWHVSYGAGLYGVMNQNFVASLNYGIAVDQRDGNSGLYIGLDFLF